MKYDVVVIGAGMSGLIAAAKASENGKKVLLVSQGRGAVNLSSGCVDILGYSPVQENVCITNIPENLKLLISKSPEHPYAKVGFKKIMESITYFKKITQEMGYPYFGDGTTNYFMPTGMGNVRPTALIGPTMADGDVTKAGERLIVGFNQLSDFYPRLIADKMNLMRSRLNNNGTWKSVTIDLEFDRVLSTLDLARWLEVEENFHKFIQKIKGIITPNISLGLPAVLGTNYSSALFQKIINELQCPVFEIPVGQPTLSGVRLYNMMLDYVKKVGVQVRLGVPVIQIDVKKEKGMTVILKTPGRNTKVSCAKLVMATGGVYNKGLMSNQNGISESIMNLPVISKETNNYTNDKLITCQQQPYAFAGVSVAADLRPVIAGKVPDEHRNIWVVGRSLAGYDPVVEKSGLGVAIATGYIVGSYLAEEVAR